MWNEGFCLLRNCWKWVHAETGSGFGFGLGGVGIGWERSGWCYDVDLIGYGYGFGFGFGFGTVFDELEETKMVKLGSNRKRCLCFLFRFESQVSSDAFTYTDQNSVCACVYI